MGRGTFRLALTRSATRVGSLRRNRLGEAEFHFIEPFEAIKFGTGFDVPEATVRRSGLSSVLMAMET
jgi:hypothetical protein